MTPKPRLRPDSYPAPPTVDQIDSYHGTPVADPYRRLEEADTPEVQAWTEAQSRLAHRILGALPGRSAYETRLKEVWNFPRMGQPVERGRFLFYTRHDGLQPQPVLYVREGDGPPRVLLDPNALSDDGTVALMEWEPSSDGATLAYALSESGADWRTVRFLDVAGGESPDDELTNIKFSSLAWDPEDAGIFYSRFPEGAADEGTSNREQSHELCHHRLGTAQREDTVVFVHPTLTGVILEPQVSEDGRFLVITIAGDSYVYNRLSVARLPRTGQLGSGYADLTVQPLYPELDAAYRFVGTAGDELLIVTTKDAPRERLVRVHPDRPQDMTTVIPEGEHVLSEAVVAGGQLIVTRMENAHDVVERWSMDGKLLGTIDLPGIGSTPGAGIRAKSTQRRVFIPYSSFLTPPEILVHDLDAGTTEPYFRPEIPGFNPYAYETTQLFATSADGTRVPLFVTAARTVRLDGTNRTILYGYGGFDISMKPNYPNWLPAWLEAGGIYAVAVLRGGGEFGEQWHLDGMFEKKQNVFDDFAAAAETLIAEGYTTSARLAIEGGSNGGLLVAASMLQHPDLFGAVLCHVPVADMLRYQHFSAGRYWTSEFGDAERNESHFRALLAYSPVHNVVDGRRYPPILIMSADHDDRVVPMHSKKLAARLQAADRGENVVLLRIETKAGHGAGKPTAKQIELRADVLAFLDATTGS